MVWQVQSYCPDTSVAYVVIAYPHAPRGGDAIANGYVYRGKRIPALQGTRVFGDNRGGGNGRWSSDFEDIVYVLNNRNSIWEELQASDAAVKAYLKEQFRFLLENEYFDEWISVHLEHNEQRRLRIITGGLSAFSRH